MVKRSRRRGLWLLLVVVLALLALAWWFPARWAWLMVRGNYPTVHVRTVSGSVWQGRASGLMVNGQRLGQLHWTLDRAAVFGRMRGTVDLAGAGVMVHGHIARAADGAIVARDLQFEVPMSRLKVLWPAGMRLGGSLRGRVFVVRLLEGWPVQLRANVTWRSAWARTSTGKVLLGDFTSRWSAPGGSVIRADLADTGQGPLALDGHFVASALGWRLRARLHKRRDEPGLEQWLQRVGQRQSDGSVRIERRGGLAMRENHS